MTSDFNGDGLVDMQVVDTMDYLANGDVVTTSQTQGRFGNDVSTTIVTSSGNGLVTTTAYDFDSDQAVDLTEISTRSYLANGDVTDSVTQFSEDGGLIYQSVTTAQGDGRRTDADVDLDGDATSDIITAVTIEDNGDTKTATQYLNASVFFATMEQVLSADGLTLQSSTDRNADGLNELIVSDVTTLGDAGETLRMVSYSEDLSASTQTSLATATYRTDGDRLGSTVSFDFTGDATFEFVTDITTEYLVDGKVKTTEIME